MKIKIANVYKMVKINFFKDRFSIKNYVMIEYFLKYKLSKTNLLIIKYYNIVSKFKISAESYIYSSKKVIKYIEMQYYKIIPMSR